MARIVYSGLVTEIKGSVGGTTFQSNRSGYIVRNKQYKGPVRSVGNVEAGRAFAIASRRWQSLTAAQRADYNTMAATYSYTDLWGNTKTLTGFQWFMASTNNQFRVDGIGLPLAPAGDPTIIPPVLGLSANSTSCTVNILDISSSNADLIFIYATPVVRSYTYVNRLTYRFLKFANFSSPGSIPCHVEWSNVYGVNWSDMYGVYKGYILFFCLFAKSGQAGHSSFVPLLIS
jgi:hypothetical protein